MAKPNPKRPARRQPTISFSDSYAYLNDTNEIRIDQFVDRLQHTGFDLNGLILPDGLRLITQPVPSYIYGVIEFPPGVYPIRYVGISRVSLPYIAAFFTLHCSLGNWWLDRVAPAFSVAPLTDRWQMLCYPAFPNCMMGYLGMCGGNADNFITGTGRKRPLLITAARLIRDSIFHSRFNHEYGNGSAYVAYYRRKGFTFTKWSALTKKNPNFALTHDWVPMGTLERLWDSWGPRPRQLYHNANDLARIVFNHPQ